MLQEKDSWIIDDIRISGLQRVSAGSVFAVMPVGLGEEIDQELFKEIASSIFQTGKFDDVKLGRDGNALLIDLEETDEDKKYGDQKCKGKFKITKSQRECGYNVYDEYQYVITEQGIGCEYPPGHKQRKYKDLCNLNEECVLDQDCERGKCVNEQCKMEFECSTNMLDNCLFCVAVMFLCFIDSQE